MKKISKTKNYDNNSYGSDYGFMYPENTESSSTAKFVPNKNDNELFLKQNDKIYPVIRVKRTTMPNKEIKIKILNNDDVIFTLESSKFTKKENEFLESITGFLFLLNYFKVNNNTNLTKFKKDLKEKLKSNEQLSDETAANKKSIASKSSK